MFDYNKMIKRAIEFFPRWTDIRKRYKTSNGGNLLGSVLEESLKIEEAIEDYIKSYFLETYEGHENEVMAFSYMANIGKIADLNRLSVYYDNKLLMITQDTRIFNEDKYDEYVYYEDGSLHIKESLYDKKPLTIIIDDEEIAEYDLIKYHVWNIFDEFATFVNTRRYENETNKQLLDRILYITKNLPNSSELGLKNAIISELMFFDPEITLDDIKIEKATPQNLLKPYEDFESLLDKMMYVNRDVLKCKRWDFDYWEYEFESISYMPHKWDETLNYWQNGIGHGEDLSVIIADSNNTTDAKITLYNKTLEAFEKYVYNKNIEYDLNFKMTKFNNILNKSNIKYKIKASELTDITNEDIELHVYESQVVDEERNVEDLYSFGRGIQIIDNGVLESNDLNWYKLQFKQKDDKDFKITTATVRYVNDKTGATDDYKNLIVQQPGFIINAEKELVSSNNQKVIKRAEDFNENNGFITTDKGIELLNTRSAGSASLPLNNYEGMLLTVDFECEKVDVPQHIISAKGCYWNDLDEFVIRGDYSIEDKKVQFELETNTFEFEVVSSKITGRCTVTVIDNGVEQTPVVLEPRQKFSIEETLYPRKVKIIIETLSFNDVVLGSFKYSSFLLGLTSEKQETLKKVDGKPMTYNIPNIKDNNLKISLLSNTGKKPIIKDIKIGRSVDDIVYTTDVIQYKSLCSRKFTIKTTAEINLIEIRPLDLQCIIDSYLSMILYSYGYVKGLFSDNVNRFLESKAKELNKYSPGNIVDTMYFAEYEMLTEITTQLLNDYISTDVFVPYLNKIFIKDESKNDIRNTFAEYVDNFISDAKKINIKISQLDKSYTLAQIFPELDKPVLEFIDKAEWIDLAYYLADELSDKIEKSLTVNKGVFNPRVLYKGDRTNAKESYVRLDLSEYETVTSVVPDKGECQMILESGVVYYNILLNNGDIVSSIKISGTKNKENRVIPLEDMILFNIPDFNRTYDKILCSRLMDSVIISRTNPGGTPYNTLVKLSSEMLSGLYATKYEMKMPGHIGCRYGNHTLGSNDNPVQYQTFDYISFYPAGGVIHEAINEFNSYIEDNRDIKIANNFTPNLDMNKLLVYTVENINKSDKDKYIIKFHNETNVNEDINNLDSWCVGQHSIAIHNNIDLANDISYNMNTYDINRKEIISSAIEIKDTYIINNNMILDTCQFIIEPPENTTLKYEEYDGTSEKAHLLKTEEIIVDSNRFNKLIYSNIDSIFHISKTRYDNAYIKDSNLSYNLLDKQGIIIWNRDIEVGTRIYITYSIKKPIGFLIDIEDLYKAIDYDVEAYNKLDTVVITDVKENDLYDISNIAEIDVTDLVFIECTNPTFEGVLVNKDIHFKKFIEKDYVLVKSGYYYINGREYFLYSDDEDDDIINNKYYTSENINISGGEVVTYKPTNNYVSNTEMRLRGKAFIYNYKCDKELKYGVSNLNTLTACDSFNEWTYFAMTPKLVQGYNGLAMQFTPSLSCSYAYLEITQALEDEEINYISLMASKDLQIYLGEEEPYLDIKFNRSLNINLAEEIPNEGSETRLLTMIKDKNTKYYLVVQGSGVLDDIIITTDKNRAVNGHSKNIDLLGLDLLETKIQGSEYRITIEDNKDYSPYEASLMSNGYFKTTSKLDWYITRVASFEKEKEFFNCVLNNVHVSKAYINTNKGEGSIITPPIYLNNQDTIKRFIFKINDIELDAMTGFNTFIYTCDTFDGDYKPIGSFTSNRQDIDGRAVSQYIKLKIEIPANKIIDNVHIYAEYKSDKENPLKLTLNESGYIESKIYDLQDTLDYRIKDLGIEDISNINDIELYIRASRDIEKLEIWHDWQRIYINEDLTLKEYLKFYDVRFMQIKIVLKTRKSYIKFNHLDVEVI